MLRFVLKFLLVSMLVLSAQAVGAQDLPKASQTPQEKPEKPPKEKKQKPPKVKKEKSPKPDTPKNRQRNKSGDDIPENGVSQDSLPSQIEKEAPKDLIGGVDDTSRVSVPCWRYRTGYMEFVDKNFQGIKIRRTKKKEFHTNTIDGNKMVFKIQWESDHVYKLVFVKAKLPSRFKKGYSMTCNMVDCWDEYYDCDCSLNGIVQYASVLKTLSPKELRAKAKEEQRKLKEAENPQKETKAKQDKPKKKRSKEKGE